MPAGSSMHPTEDAMQVVRGYLAAMERRDLATASAMLAPGFAMVFPGGKRLETLEQLVDWARTAVPEREEDLPALRRGACGRATHPSSIASAHHTEN